MIVVGGTIALLSISSFIIFSEKARSAEGKQILISLLGAQRRWAMDNNGAYTATLNELDVTIPNSNSSVFCIPTVKTSDPIVFITRKNSESDGDCAAGGTSKIGDGDYTLTINSNGTISCFDGAKQTISGICSKINH